MDPMIAKLVTSRQKSVASVKSQIEAFERLKANATNAGVVVALNGQLTVARQRLAKLEAELAGFQELAGDPRQVDVPGTGKTRPGR